ncbi:MAG: hypothetical protein WBM40_14465, partial [Thiohalocapsa sp.]
AASWRARRGRSQGEPMSRGELTDDFSRKYASMASGRCWGRLVKRFAQTGRAPLSQKPRMALSPFGVPTIVAADGINQGNVQFEMALVEH